MCFSQILDQWTFSDLKDWSFSGYSFTLVSCTPCFSFNCSLAKTLVLLYGVIASLVAPPPSLVALYPGPSLRYCIWTQQRGLAGNGTQGSMWHYNSMAGGCEAVNGHGWLHSLSYCHCAATRPNTAVYLPPHTMPRACFVSLLCYHSFSGCVDKDLLCLPLVVICTQCIWHVENTMWCQENCWLTPINAHLVSFFSTQQFHGSNRNYSVRTDDGEAICSYIDDFQKHPEQALVRHSIYCRDVSRLSRPLVLLCINWTCLHVFSCTVRHARATSLTRFTAITVMHVCVCVHTIMQRL